MNDRVALSQAEMYMKERINKRHMQNGVTLIDPMNTYISPDARIGQDTVIYPGTVLKGQAEIGDECVIGPHTEIEDSSIGARTVIKQSVVNRAKLGMM